MMGTPEDRWMTPAEVAKIFSVSVRTISNWADAGKMVSIRTPGGQRRFAASEVARLFESPS